MTQRKPRSATPRRSEVIHNEDISHFDSMDAKQQTTYEDLANQLEVHIRENRSSDLRIHERLDELQPIVRLAPRIEQMVEERIAYTLVASQMLKIILALGAFIGLVVGAIKLWAELKP